MRFGATRYSPPSRSLDEIRSELAEQGGNGRRASRYASRHEYRSDGGGRRSGFWPSSAPDANRERMVDAALAAGRTAPRGTTGAEAAGLRTGDDVRHVKFGEGVIIMIEGDGDKAGAVVGFGEGGEKRLLGAWSPLEKLGCPRCSSAPAWSRGTTSPWGRSSSAWPGCMA